MKIFLNILFVLTMVYSLGSLFNPHSEGDSYFYSFAFCGSLLGILADLRDWIYSNPKDKYFVYYPVGNTDPIR